MPEKLDYRSGKGGTTRVKTEMIELVDKIRAAQASHNESKKQKEKEFQEGIFSSSDLS